MDVVEVGKQMIKMGIEAHIIGTIGRTNCTVSKQEQI